MKNIFLAILFLFPALVFAQQPDDRLEVIAAIEELFDAMRAGDAGGVRQAFHPEARLFTVYTDEQGVPQSRESTVDRFAAAVGREREEVLNEEIWNYDIQIDGRLAQAWTEYSFFLDDRLSHCGYNAFHLIKNDSEWKILHVTDTRRRENCRTTEASVKDDLHRFIDNWHLAASLADEQDFFGRMAENAVYLGTDAAERWLRDEFQAWARPYFEEKPAWDFTPRDRHLYLSQDEKLAWFEESLDTWMGACRGSGVLKKYPDGWKIQHYHLALTVPNEKIQAFIELVKGQ